jgi:hypothetical protein
MDPREEFLRIVLDMYRSPDFCNPQYCHGPAPSGLTPTEAVVRWTALELGRYMQRRDTGFPVGWYPRDVHVHRYGGGGQDLTQFLMQWSRGGIVVTTRVERPGVGIYTLFIHEPGRDRSVGWTYRVWGKLQYEGTPPVDKRARVGSYNGEYNPLL